MIGAVRSQACYGTTFPDPNATDATMTRPILDLHLWWDSKWLGVHLTDLINTCKCRFLILFNIDITMCVFSKKNILFSDTSFFPVYLTPNMLVSLNKIFCFFLENTHFNINIKQKRNLHLHVLKEFGEENVRNLWKWEKIEKKMADFQIHRRFSLRCLKYDVTPVSVRLKSTIKTPRGCKIVKKAECIRSINNTPELYMYHKEAFIHQLREVLDKTTMDECQLLINNITEARHIKVLDHQRSKFDVLYQQKLGVHSNVNHEGGHWNMTLGKMTTGTSKWVRNLSSTALTEAQEHLVAYGPNFAITPKCPPNGEYLMAIEYACSKLNQG